MTDTQTVTFHRFETPEFPCDYYQDGRQARFSVARAFSCSQKTLYDILSLKGYRRQGTLTYRPVCGGCRSCIASRIPADLFVPNRTMRKVWNRNQDLDVRPVSRVSDLADENYDLYKRYEAARHAGSPMADYSRSEFFETLFSTNVETLALEYRLEGKLVLTAVADILSHGLSAVYTYFDPGFRQRSLGVFSILKELEFTKLTGRNRFLYLGFWLYGYPGMSYKERFTPFEVFWNGEWRPLFDCEDEIRQQAAEADAAQK